MNGPLKETQNVTLCQSPPKSKIGHPPWGIHKLESYAKKMRLGFSKIVSILLMIMLISIHTLNDQTLRIPKW